MISTQSTRVLEREREQLLLKSKKRSFLKRRRWSKRLVMGAAVSFVRKLAKKIDA